MLANQLTQRNLVKRSWPRILIWINGLFSADRPEENVMQWYLERKDRCNDQIWRVARDTLDSGSDVILELGLIRKSDRKIFYEKVDSIKHLMTMYVLDAPKSVRWKRVSSRNMEKGDTYSMVVPENIFEMASNMWESPCAIECSGRNVRFIKADIQNFFIEK